MADLWGIGCVGSLDRRWVVNLPYLGEILFSIAIGSAVGDVPGRAGR